MKAFLIATFATSIVIANITASKLVYFQVLWWPVTVPAGFIAFGVAFLCSDILGEVFGEKTAQATVRGTVGALTVGWILVYVAVWLPAAPSTNPATFNQTLSSSAPIVIGSVLTMCISQPLDVHIFHRLRSFTDGEHGWARNIGSTAVSQFIDTIFFIGLGFVVLPPLFGLETTPLAIAGNLIIAQYLAKLVVVAGDTPFFYLGRGLLLPRIASENPENPTH